MTARPADHAQCRETLRREAADLGVEVTVSEARPLVVGAFPPYGYRCPHGTDYWIAPTGEQIARWAADRTP
jgi:hypothetical protein